MPRPAAEWILTFDDGPLPSDIVDYDASDPNAGDELLAPLDSIVSKLRDHPAGPIPAVFFLRGPGYPWKPGRKPPKALFARGVRMILDAGHAVGIHCFKHDPELWWNWLFTAERIQRDLDRCVDYFSSMLPGRMTVFRPPYGQGGPPGVAWARRHRVRHRRWDMDTEDWLHHADAADFARRFENDPDGHLRHIVDSLPVKMLVHTFWPGANDFLLHVSVRTASYLDRILDRICEVTRLQGHEPAFVVPRTYLTPP